GGPADHREAGVHGADRGGGRRRGTAAHGRRAAHGHLVRTDPVDVADLALGTAGTAGLPAAARVPVVAAPAPAAGRGADVERRAGPGGAAAAVGVAAPDPAVVAGGRPGRAGRRRGPAAGHRRGAVGLLGDPAGDGRVRVDVLDRR